MVMLPLAAVSSCSAAGGRQFGGMEARLFSTARTAAVQLGRHRLPPSPSVPLPLPPSSAARSRPAAAAPQVTQSMEDVLGSHMSHSILANGNEAGKRHACGSGGRLLTSSLELAASPAAKLPPAISSSSRSSSSSSSKISSSSRSSSILALAKPDWKVTGESSSSSSSNTGSATALHAAGPPVVVAGQRFASLLDLRQHMRLLQRSLLGEADEAQVLPDSPHFELIQVGLWVGGWRGVKFVGGLAGWWYVRPPMLAREAHVAG